MAEEDEVEVQMISVAALAEARVACYAAATELRGIAPGAEILGYIADTLSGYAEALDDFMAELNEERAGEFAADRFPADVEDDDEPPTSTDEARKDVPPVDDAEDAPEPPEVEDGPQDAPDHDALVAAARRLKIKGYTKMSDAELAEAIAAAEA